jgi:4-hydroxy-tetrahydrodipicolinate synthase
LTGTLDRSDLHTVQLVPITAFDESGELALDPMRQLTARLYDAGIRCFIPCAGSAEFHSLDSDEIVTSIGMTREATGEDTRIMCPVGGPLRQAVSLGERALDAGADAVLVMPLAFPYLSNEGARDYYVSLMEQLDCPTLIYKKAEIPSDDLLLELADHPNLIGVKYAVNDIDAFNHIVQHDEGRIDWYCGSAERFSPFFALAGSPGYTSGAGNLCPRITLAKHAALAVGDWNEAMRLQQLILPIEDYRARCGSSYNISFLKYAIQLTGLNFGEPRPPQRQLTDAERAEIDALVPPILEAESLLSNQPAVS